MIMVPYEPLQYSQPTYNTKAGCTFVTDIRQFLSSFFAKHGVAAKGSHLGSVEGIQHCGKVVGYQS